MKYLKRKLDFAKDSSILDVDNKEMDIKVLKRMYEISTNMDFTITTFWNKMYDDLDVIFENILEIH